MKKTFLNIIMVAIVATISGVFTSCNKDDKKVVFVPDPDLILGKWDTHPQSEYASIEFKRDGTYSFEEINGNVNGIFRITESEKTKNEYGYMYYLYKIQVSGSNEFDMLWIERSIPTDYNNYMTVRFYSNNELLPYWIIFHKQ